MALTQKRLFGPAAAVTTPTDSTAGRYLVPSATTTIVKQIIFCNTSTTTAATVNVGVGTTATAANRIISALTVAPSETVTYNCNVVMTATEKLFLVASIVDVTITVSGIEEA